MLSGNPKIFAAIPARTFRDPRMTAGHFRLLGLIALHDRLNTNGAGCYAKRETFARLLGWAEQSVSRVRRDLREWNYLKASSGGEDGRTIIDRVIYTGEDRDWRTAKIGNPTGHLISENRLPNGLPNFGNRSPIDPQIGNLAISQVIEKGREPDLEAYASKQISIDKGDLADLSEAHCAKRDSRRRGFSAEEVAKLIAAYEEQAQTDPTQLRFEIRQLEQLADDETLPPELSERVVQLLEIAIANGGKPT